MGKHQLVCIENPEIQLFAGLLLQAAHDYRRVCLGQKCNDLHGTAKAHGYKTPAAELLAFFGSAWCRNLCAWMDVEHRLYLDFALGDKQGGEA